MSTPRQFWDDYDPPEPEYVDRLEELPEVEALEDMRNGGQRWAVVRHV